MLSVVLVKEERECEGGMSPVLVKEEREWDGAGECGASASEAAAAGLYADHEVKGELVLGPEQLKAQDIAYALRQQVDEAGTETVKRELSPAGAEAHPSESPCSSTSREQGALRTCCLTDYLLHESTRFSNLSFENKKHVIELGRARPDLTIYYKRRDGYFKHFHSSTYEKYNWLTGSCNLRKLFCFPCLLFSKSNGVWNRTGFSDINNLSNSAKKHVQTEKHIRSCISLHEFGNSRIEMEIDFDAHNREVERNRNLMKRLIDTVVLLGKQELARGHDEKRDSANQSNYVETLLYLSKYDSVMESHLEQCSSTSHSFSGLLGDIQNDLIDCVAAVILDEVRSEIDKAKFVSVMIDETPDVSHRELTVTFRYLTDTGLEERFVGFFDVSESRVLASQLLDTLDRYQCKDKLIGQAYDGANVTSGEYGVQVQALVLNECPTAHFVPCYAHVLNLLLSRSLENVSELKSFFGNINGLVRFFNESSKRSNLLRQFSDRRTPGAAETHWHDHSRIINVIFNCKLDMIETFNHILDNPQLWDADSLSLSEFFLGKLEDMQFCFLLHVLSEIFARTDVLSALLQSKQVDIEVAVREIDSFKSWLSDVFINQFDTIYDGIQAYSEPPRRRRRLNSEIDLKTKYSRLFVEIIHNVIGQINSRYLSFEDLTFLDLINKSKYAQYSRNFPDDKISALITEFPNLFDFTALKNELKVLYSTSSLNTLDADELYLYLNNNSTLNEAFPQLMMLCRIFLTLPVSVASAERWFSALKRIHTYTRNSQKEESLSNLAIISIEKHLLLKIQKKSNFYDNVLAHFVKKNRGIILEYK